MMLLCCYALPSSYAARKGVQVLHRTAYLAKRPTRPWITIDGLWRIGLPLSAQDQFRPKI